MTAPDPIDFSELVFDAENLVHAEMSRAISRYGVVQIKRCFDKKAVSSFSDLAMAAGVRELGGMSLLRIEHDMTTPRFDFLRLVHDSPMMPFLRSHFQSSVLMISGFHNYFRFVTTNKPEHGLPFHQDGAGFGDEPAVTCSVLFYPQEAGENVPGLQFIPRACDELLTRADPSPDTKNSYKFLEIQQEVIKEIDKGGFWVPSYEVGDALIFDKHCVHRTYMDEQMPGHRYGLLHGRLSIDVRIFPYEREDYRISLQHHRWLLSHRFFLHGPKTIVRDSEADPFQSSTSRFGLLKGGLVGGAFKRLTDSLAHRHMRKKAMQPP